MTAVSRRGLYSFFIRSWGVEVRVYVDDHDLWVGNAMRFGTEEEAGAYGEWLSAQATHARGCRVFPSQLPVNSVWPRA